MRAGIVGAFLWMYSGYTGSGPNYELDFEFIGKRGLQLNYHDGIKPGKELLLIPGDFSGKEVKLEIEFDIVEGYANFFVDGEVVYSLSKAKVESFGMRWIDKPMFPLFDAWAVNNSGWTGGNFDPNAMAFEAVLKERYIAIS